MQLRSQSDNSLTLTPRETSILPPILEDSLRILTFTEVERKLYKGTWWSIRPALSAVHTHGKPLDSWKSLFYLYTFSWLELDLWLNQHERQRRENQEPPLDPAWLTVYWLDPLRHMPATNQHACREFLADEWNQTLEELVQIAQQRIRTHQQTQQRSVGAWARAPPPKPCLDLQQFHANMIQDHKVRPRIYSLSSLMNDSDLHVLSKPKPSCWERWFRCCRDVQ